MFTLKKGTPTVTTVIDFASGPPSAASIKAAGHEGVVLYISAPREDWMTGKNPTREYLDSLDAHGLKFAFVYQLRAGGSIETGDAGRGYDGGVEDATIARDRLNELQCAGHPVYFAVDWDVSLTEWNTRVYRYFTGAVAVLGRQRVGAYGHSRAVAWAQQDGVIADLGDGRALGWVTQSWQSRNPDGTPKGQRYAALFQGVHNVGGPDGVQIDINDVWNPDWGWRGVASVDSPGTPRIALSDLPRVDELVPMNKHYTRGRTREVKYITRHHLAGIGDARWAWNIWQQRAASGHFVVGPDTTVGQLVDIDDTAWGNADAGSNNETIIIEHSNSTGNPWWDISDPVIRRGAELAAELCIVKDLGRPLFGLNIRDHNEFTSTSCPHHLARGGKYHDPWMHHAQAHYDKLTKPQPADKPPTFLEKLMTDTVQSYVNPDKSFPAPAALSLIDRQGWEDGVLSRALFYALGIDPQAVIDAAITADNAGDDVDAAIRQTLNLKER